MTKHDRTRRTVQFSTIGFAVAFAFLAGVVVFAGREVAAPPSDEAR